MTRTGDPRTLLVDQKNQTEPFDSIARSEPRASLLAHFDTSDLWDFLSPNMGTETDRWPESWLQEAQCAGVIFPVARCFKPKCKSGNFVGK